MIVRRFLLWARTASPGDRAEAVSALARAYLYGELAPADRRDAETALTAMLDDPSPLVRRALAEAVANAPDAPRHIVVALASDQSAIAALVLARSPLLTDADLVDAAALGDDFVQTAIALRPRLTSAVAAALAEIACAQAVSELLGNPGATLAVSTFARINERLGEDPEIREALLARADCPVDVRQAIAVALASRLELFVVERGWLSAERSARIVREAREKTTVALSAGPAADALRLVTHLRRTGQLTPAMILRAVLSRAMPFVEAAFADLADMPAKRVVALLHDPRGAGFPALYRRAKLPPALLPAFEAAFSALREPQGEGAGVGAQLSRRMVERVLSACAALPAEEAGKLLVLLRRYEVEAAREEAREASRVMAEDAALDVALSHVERGIVEAIRSRRLGIAA
ncbi:DUF2336 domain-containing protein [Salinarimonas ramus]|uniref:DUF2336 domain-containing protein n=1 Tax=Salinarimonas ramus TaxID=690164 RepID=A0A917V2I1_9HYPH|nr:DUF2336 domain-containing protein [Salinarimonas ramus]GGK24085.1 hypothetical protein GCM10011322_08430 [Salinarimonas ramus]